MATSKMSMASSSIISVNPNRNPFYRANQEKGSDRTIVETYNTSTQQTPPVIQIQQEHGYANAEVEREQFKEQVNFAKAGI